MFNRHKIEDNRYVARLAAKSLRGRLGRRRMFCGTANPEELDKIYMCSAYSGVDNRKAKIHYATGPTISTWFQPFKEGVLFYIGFPSYTRRPPRKVEIAQAQELKAVLTTWALEHHGKPKPQTDDSRLVFLLDTWKTV